MFSLIGIVIVVVGFVLRINPLLVVTVAGLATGIAGGLGPLEVVAAFGKAFITSRYVAIVWLVLPVIGLLEHAGLKERARAGFAGLFRHSPDHCRARPDFTWWARADGAPAYRADGRGRGGERVW
jgi:predicted histidine transporter YuiF (NhaC family)